MANWRTLLLTAAVLAPVLAVPVLGTGQAWASPQFAVIGTIPVAAGPVDAAVDPGRHVAYVLSSTGSAPSMVSMIDETTGQVTRTFAVGPAGSLPMQLAVDGSTGTLFVLNLPGIGAAHGTNGFLQVVDPSTGQITHTIEVGPFPTSVAVDPAARTVYVTDNNTDLVSVISEATGTVTATIPVGAEPQGIGIDPASGTIWVGTPTTARSQSSVPPPTR